MNEKQNRWKSPVLWAAIVAQICAILVMVGLLDTVLSDQIQAVTAGVLQLLAIVGIVNNPTDRESW